MKAEDFSASSQQGNSDGMSSTNVSLVCNMPSPTSVGTRNGENFNKLSRQVSQDVLSLLTEGDKRHGPQYVSGCEEDEDVASETSTRCSSPMRCVSECDKAESTSKRDSSIPHPRNPLHDSKLLSVHVQACRLEAELLPLRQILSRTMYHPTLNRKGIFNSPVDPVALRLPDYHLVIAQPMDLGTVKTKLHSVEYKSRHEAVRDVRLVFQNAMKYNPPMNPVHLAAKELLAFFNEAYLVAYPDGTSDASTCYPQSTSANEGTSTPLGGAAIARTVSSCDTENAQNVPHPESLDFTPLSKPTQGLQATRRSSSLCGGSLPSSLTLSSRKRRLSVSFDPAHSCDSCLGRTCGICQQGCLSLEPSLLICNGVNCAGSKIRKGAMYHIAPDGSRQYCQRCYSSLGALLPQGGSDEKLRYKRDLLKRKNDEELEERWIKCNRCDQSMHRMCVMFNDYASSANEFVCPNCISDQLPRTPFEKIGLESLDKSIAYTFVSGTDKPVPVTEVAGPGFVSGQDMLSSDSLPETAISAFVQKKVRELVRESGISQNAERTIFVRVISDCNKSFKVPDVVRKHFRVLDVDNKSGSVSPPEEVKYNSKCISLFQKLDGLDVCIFSMYVQEYNGYRDASKKRVYIAYLDSVEHFRPRPLRTSVYHEVLVSYLATARERGYNDAYIWACPPSRGNSFVFWNHPSSQRTPTTERLVSWYHGALSRAIDRGILTDVRSLFETSFEKYLGKKDKDDTTDLISGGMPCPPLLDGDFWIEEAVRIHSSSIARHLKTRLPSEAEFAKVTDSLEFYKQRLDHCPAIQISILLRERLMAHPSSVHFRRPVNAAALKLKDYHKIVTRPMDFGTIFSKCVHGEYITLYDLVADVELVISNAKLFNPEGHFVHIQANEVHSFFFQELNTVTTLWRTTENTEHTWTAYGGMSMSLDKCLTQGSAETEAVADKETGCTPTSPESRPCTPMPERKLVTADVVTPSFAAHEVRITSSSKASTNELQVVAAKVSPSNNSRRIANPDVRGIELLSGPEAVQYKMVGADTWLMDKRNTIAPKRPSVTKKTCHKRRRSSVSTTSESSEEPSNKRRRQTWLGEEVGESIRKMRTTFFACSLKVNNPSEEQDEDKVRAYKEYVKFFDESEFRDETVVMSRIADARHVLLEFSQFRNLEFDTLRHAKFSTAVMLYHLHHKDAPGMVPICTSCKRTTEGVRWHKIKRGGERRRSSISKATPKVCKEGKWNPEELCSNCYSSEPRGDDYNPIQVSLRCSGKGG